MLPALAFALAFVQAIPGARCPASIPEPVVICDAVNHRMGGRTIAYHPHGTPYLFIDNAACAVPSSLYGYTVHEAVHYYQHACGLAYNEPQAYRAGFLARGRE